MKNLFSILAVVFAITVLTTSCEKDEESSNVPFTIKLEVEEPYSQYGTYYAMCTVEVTNDSDASSDVELWCIIGAVNFKTTDKIQGSGTMRGKLSFPGAGTYTIKASAKSDGEEKSTSKTITIN